MQGCRAGQGSSVSGRVVAMEVEEVVRFWVYVNGPAVMCETKMVSTPRFFCVFFLTPRFLTRLTG